MNRFVLDGTDFGVDANESRCSIGRQEDGMATIDAVIVGDQDVYERLAEGEDTEWSWTLYPPRFQVWHRLHLLPGENFEHQYSEQEESESEVSLYFMEHHFPLRLRVRVAADASELHVSGEIEFLGRPTAVDIRWARSGPESGGASAG